MRQHIEMDHSAAKTGGLGAQEPALFIKGAGVLIGGRRILTDISFELFRGEVFGIVGPNGAGKTTLLRMIQGMLRPDPGEVILFGPLRDRGAIGYLPEERGLYQDVSACEAISYLATLQCGRPEAVAANMALWADRLGVSHELKRKVRTLSKGTQQKIQLIAVLAADPDLVILDEPLSGLDPVGAALLKGVIAELAAMGRTLLVVTHQMDLVEKVCSRVLMLHRGRTVLYGAVADLLAASDRLDMISVETDADLEDCSLVAQVERSGRHRLVRLKAGLQSADLVAWLAHHGYCLSELRQIRPSLESIFLEAADAEHRSNRGV